MAKFNDMGGVFASAEAAMESWREFAEQLEGEEFYRIYAMGTDERLDVFASWYLAKYPRVPVDEGL